MKLFLNVVLVILLSTVIGSVYGANIPLSWQVPETRTDGTPLSVDELASYTLHYGTAEGGPYSDTKLIEGGATTSITIDGLSDGEWFFVISVTDTEGRNSGFSNEVKKLAVTMEPTPPILNP